MYQLKDWKMEYAPGIAKYANNKNIADNLRNIFPYPYWLEDAEEFIRYQLSDESSGEFTKVIVIDGEAAGVICVYFQDDIYIKNAELGYWIGEPFWGKGIMTEVVKEFCLIVFSEFDIERIYSQAFERNFASRRVLEKAGFKLDGILENSVYKNDILQNSCMYALLRKNQ